MQEVFKVLDATRQRIADLFDHYSVEQLNEIPNGFNNNLIWNACHVLATQHLLTYNLCGLKIPLDSWYIDHFRKGTSPDVQLDDKQIAEVKHLLQSSVKTLKADYDAGKFQNFKTYQTSYGVELTNIEEAIVFNTTHEGMHLGYMMSIRKLV